MYEHIFSNVKTYTRQCKRNYTAIKKFLHCRIIEDYVKERAAEARKAARCCSLPLEQVLALKEELERETTVVTN